MEGSASVYAYSHWLPKSRQLDILARRKGFGCQKPRRQRATAPGGQNGAASLGGRSLDHGKSGARRKDVEPSALPSKDVLVASTTHEYDVLGDGQTTVSMDASATHPIIQQHVLPSPTLLRVTASSARGGFSPDPQWSARRHCARRQDAHQRPYLPPLQGSQSLQGAVQHLPVQGATTDSDQARHPLEMHLASQGHRCCHR